MPMKTEPTAAPSREDAPHAIVIGSGFGGLAAAVRLGARGYRVTVLEKLDAGGPRCTGKTASPSTPARR
jgi:phytoene desaturase